MKEKYSVIRFKKIDSTSLYGIREFDRLKHAQIILSEEQTKGQGRQEKSWLSPYENNLYFSIILKTQFARDNMPNVTQVAALGVAKTLEKWGITSRIKWPNDVLVNKKKISGILASGIFEKKQLKGTVLGVGINVNMSDRTLQSINPPATSLRAELKRQIPREEILTDFLDQFFTYEKQLEKGNAELILQDINSYFNLKNKVITIQLAGKIFKGTAKGLTKDGALILEHNGLEKKFYSGEIISSM